MNTLLLYLLFSILGGYFTGYNLGYRKGKKKGMEIASNKAPLDILRKSLERGVCIICNHRVKKL